MKDAAAHAAAVAESAAREARQRARDLGFALNRTAEALELSANLAEEHAARQARTGLTEAAANELRAASRAREASALARARAVRCLELGGTRLP
jgi:hypothetical protein